jgi:hypothetical protein
MRGWQPLSKNLKTRAVEQTEYADTTGGCHHQERRRSRDLGSGTPGSANVRALKGDST